MFLCTKTVPGSAVVASDSCTLESEHPIQRICRQSGHQGIVRLELPSKPTLGACLSLGSGKYRGNVWFNLSAQFLFAERTLDK